MHEHTHADQVHSFCVTFFETDHFAQPLGKMSSGELCKSLRDVSWRVSVMIVLNQNSVAVQG